MLCVCTYLCACVTVYVCLRANVWNKFFVRASNFASTGFSRYENCSELGDVTGSSPLIRIQFPLLLLLLLLRHPQGITAAAPPSPLCC